MAHKRKFNEVKVPEVTKTSELEITEGKKKAMTKNEMKNMYNILVTEHEELLKLHKENLQRIEHL